MELVAPRIALSVGRVPKSFWKKNNNIFFFFFFSQHVFSLLHDQKEMC